MRDVRNLSDSELRAEYRRRVVDEFNRVNDDQESVDRLDALVDELRRRARNSGEHFVLTDYFRACNEAATWRAKGFAARVVPTIGNAAGIPVLCGYDVEVGP